MKRGNYFQTAEGTIMNRYGKTLNVHGNGLNKQNAGYLKKSNIYCGVQETPKGKRRGTAEECKERGQLRYYGLKKYEELRKRPKKSKEYDPHAFLSNYDNKDVIKTLGLTDEKIIKKIKSQTLFGPKQRTLNELMNKLIDILTKKKKGDSKTIIHSILQLYDIEMLTEPKEKDLLTEFLKMVDLKPKEKEIVVKNFNYIIKEFPHVKNAIKSVIKSDERIEIRQKKIDDTLKKMKEQKDIYGPAKQIYTRIWRGSLDRDLKDTKPRTEQRQKLLQEKRELTKLEKTIPEKAITEVKELDNEMATINNIHSSVAENIDFIRQAFGLEVEHIGYGYRKASNIYCGIKEVPKGKKRGTMKQCKEQGQFRYFGLNV